MQCNGQFLYPPLRLKQPAGVFEIDHAHIVRAVVCIADRALKNVISRERSNATPHLFDITSAFKWLIERILCPLCKILVQYHYLPLT